MYTVDLPKLRGKMGEKGYNITSLSRKVGVNRNTLSNYFANPATIPYGKIAALAETLCDNRQECVDIFFAVELS